MSDYLESKVLGSYFRSKNAMYMGTIRIYGTYTEYRVIAGIPEVDSMLEIIGFENGVLLTQVNNYLFENGRGFIQC